MENENICSDILVILRAHCKIAVAIVLCCLGISGAFAITRPTVYQSELTFAVKMNRAIPDENSNNKKIQEIARIVESDEVRKPISHSEAVNKYNSDLLHDDYRSCNVRVQNLATLGMFRIFAHGATPEEAQRNCTGLYEHFVVFSDKYNEFRLTDTSPAGSFAEYVQLNLDKAYSDYEQYLTRHGESDSGTSDHFDQEKIRLQNKLDSLEKLNQRLLSEELEAKWRDSWQVELIDVASLPSQPVAKHTGFIICLGAMAGVFMCLLFGVSLALKRRRDNIAN